MPSMSQPDRDLVEVFSFLSGLYFRGKLAYAEAFARPPPRLKTGALVITTKPSVSASTLRHARKALRDPLSEDLNISPRAEALANLPINIGRRLHRAGPSRCLFSFRA